MLATFGVEVSEHLVITIFAYSSLERCSKGVSLAQPSSDYPTDVQLEPHIYTLSICFCSVSGTISCLLYIQARPEIHPITYLGT